jgi:multisubunit Na+/H+ antiporter MnhF subunit
MNALWRTLALISVALVVAIASFLDHIAFTMGKIVLVGAIAVLAFAILSAGLSLRGKNIKQRSVLAVDSVDTILDPDTSHRPSA